jgi:hypothetical protein
MNEDTMPGHATTPPAKKPISRPLKPKDITFIEAKSKGLPDYKAAMAATGTTDMNVASTQAARMLQNVTLREELDRVLADKGITIDRAVQPIQDALNDDDLDMQLKGSDRALKLMGAYQNQNTPQGNTINFNFNK